MDSRLTINVMPQYVANWAKVWGFLRLLEPVAVVVGIDDMKAANRVYELQSALPNTLIIGRYIFSQDGGMHLKPDDSRKYIVSPLDALSSWGDLGKGGRMLYLLNEPQANGALQDDIARLSAWMLEAISLASERGIRLCIGNFGVGHPMLMGNGEYDARFDDVLTALSKTRDSHALGMHVYQPADTLTRLEGLIKRCKTLGIQPPRVHITEAGFDAGSGSDPLNGYRSRGYSGTQFGLFQVDKVKNVYSPYMTDDVLQSVATFCWGNDASWKNFNVESDTDWQATVLDAANKGYLSVTTKAVTKPFLTPMPKPTDAASPTRVRVTNTVNVNLRSGASTDYQTAGSLKKGDEITLYQTPFKQATNGQVWRWVDVSETIGGWVCSDVLTYEAITPPAEIPTTAPFLEVSADMCKRMIDAYTAQSAANRQLATSYTLAAQDALSMAQQWRGILDQITPVASTNNLPNVTPIKAVLEVSS